VHVREDMCVGPDPQRREYCLRCEVSGGSGMCLEAIRLRDAEGGLLVEYVRRARGGAEEVVTVLALLPREVYVVEDPYFGTYFVAYEGGRLIAASDDLREFLNAVHRWPYYVYRFKRQIVAIRSLLPYVEKTISAGLTEDGAVADPLGVLDTADYGIEPLKTIYKWVKSAYSGRDAKLAWFNVTAIVAELVAPLIKAKRKPFFDYVIYNYGEGAAAIVHVLEQMLGGEPAREAYGTVIYGAPAKAGRPLKHLLTLNRLPLVLANQTKKTLKINAELLRSAPVGVAEVRIGRRYEEVKNLRGTLVFAAVPPKDVDCNCIELKWDAAPAQTPPPVVKPIYGFAASLWRRYGSELAESNSLFELIKKLTTAIAHEYPEAEEIVNFTMQATEEALSHM